MDKPSSHSQKVPYARKEGRKSLFSKMKDSMKDMLSPSWLSDLVQTVKKNSPSKEEKVPESAGDIIQPSITSGAVLGFQVSQPPTQTGPSGFQSTPSPQGAVQMGQDMPFKSRGPFMGNGQPGMVDFPAMPAGSGIVASPYQQVNFPPPPIAEFTSAQLPLTRITDKTDSMLAQEDAMSQRSDVSKSTSGCSSMIPQTDVVQTDVVRDKRKASEVVADERAGLDGRISPQEEQASKRQKLNSGALNQTFSRRLSDTFMHRGSVSTVGSRPAFNTSLFGSPLDNESSLLGTSFHESSFYPGKTTFGGRSSQSFRHQRKKMDLNQSLPGRLSVPVKAFMKARPRLNPNQEAVTSSTAKRILEALDRMPTPLNDAKKIPVVPRSWTESPSFLRQDSGTPQRFGPPRQKLNISAQATISRNRQVSFTPVSQPKASTSQASVEKVGMPARQDTVVLPSESLGAPSGKMRRDKSYHRGSASVKPTLEEDDTIVIPDLQTEFTLPVKSMPKFSFGTPATAGSSEPASQPAVKLGTQSIDSTVTPTKPALNFTFSSPIVETVPENKPPSPEKYPGFQFSSPLSAAVTVSQKTGISATTSSYSTIATTQSSNKPSFSFASSSSKMQFDFAAAAKPKPKINGPVEPFSGGLQAATELKQGSVMDILGGSGKVVSASSTKMSGINSLQSSSPLNSASQSSDQPSLSSLFKPSGWSCSVCLVNNKDEAEKCAACQSAKPKGSASNEKGSTTTQAPVLSTLFKPSGWKCDVCFVNNQDSVDKCAACRATKPKNSASGNTGSSAAQALPLSSMFKPSGWKCDMCLVNNQDSASKCVACQTAKPGGGSQATKSAPLSSLFKQSGWSCDVCLVSNKDDVNKCAACQAQRPGSKTSEGSSSIPVTSTIQPGNWICTSCRIQNKKDDTVCGACKTPRSASKSDSIATEYKKPDDLFAKLKPASGTWECEMCLVQNKPEVNSCLACQTPKPLKFFKHPPGDWTCDTCLVTNKESSVNCVACNYARPGVPRTQAVPSIAKSYSISQTSGFSLPASQTSGISVSTTGGFKLSAPVSVNTQKPGFDTSKSVSDTSKPSGAGFKFDSSSAGSTSGTGFKIGAPATSESDKTSASSGGFKFGTSAASNEKHSAAFKIDTVQSETKENALKSAGFQFGKSEGVSSNIKLDTAQSKTKESGLNSGGFQFGKSDSSSSSLSNSASTGIGFAFGQKSDTSSSKDQVQATTSAPGGFTFKPSDSATSAMSLGTVDTSKTVTTSVSQKFGGFNFSTVNSMSNSSAVTSTPGSPLFTATKVSDSSILSGGLKSEENKPVIGGFTFSQKTEPTNTSTVTKTFAQESSKVTSPKRGRDEDTEEPLKKQAPSFNFGQAVSTSFQFGARTTATTSNNSGSSFAFGQKLPSSSVSAFGQQPISTGNLSTPVFGQQTTTVTSAAASGSLFAFGAQSNAVTSTNSTITPVFGQANTTTTSSSIFQFGQANNTSAATSTPSLFKFVQDSSKTTAVTTAAAAVPGLFQFGQGSNMSTTPAFQFGQASSASTAVPTATSATPVFQFGQESNSSSVPFNFGAKSNTQTSGNVTSFNSTPSFNFTAQKTESSGGSGLFKFGAQSSQPSPATTPAFGAGSGFGSTPAFGSASAGSGAFGGNAPSTTPAFGSTPPAFGASNSGTGQAAPVFGAFGNGGQQPAAPAQTNSVFQFGAKPAESTTAAPSTGFNFSANPAGLGSAPNFSFTAQTPSSAAFNFSATSSHTPGDRKIKKAVRKIKR